LNRQELWVALNLSYFEGIFPLEKRPRLFLNFRQNSQRPTTMPTYRLYFLDQTGHIFKAEELDAQDDSDAHAQAARVVTQDRWELWERARLVAQSHGDERRHG
jgi:hypothetical protein